MDIMRPRLPKPNPATGLLEPSTVAVGDPRPNMTLICLAMRIFGPLHERTLCVVLLAFQFACLGPLFGTWRQASFLRMSVDANTQQESPQGVAVST